MRLLFNSVQAAQEIAFMLRCQYNGCNGIVLSETYDTIAVKAAIELTGAEFCFEGDSQFLTERVKSRCTPSVVDQWADLMCQRLGEDSYLSPF